MQNAQHSAATVEHGTPPEWCDMGRRVLGGDFDLDPASSHYWNRFHVRARRICDAADNGLERVWPVGRVICNPPGGGLVQPFFRRCVEAWRLGSSVWWIGFSLEQLLYLQDDGLFSASFRRMVPRQRVDFLRASVASPLQVGLFAGEPADPPEQQGSPTHGNYIVLMPQGPQQVRRFDREADAIGAVPF